MKSLRIRICLVLAVILTCMFSAQAAGKVFFAAPNGLPTNNGSQASPWDLQTALTHRPNIVTAGDTIYLRGGVYRGTYLSTLTGAPGSPITVRSLPGEWAIIDANQSLNLASAIGVGGGTITFSGDVNLPNPAIVMIEGEHLQIVDRVGNTFRVNARGWNGTATAPHPAGAPVRAVGEILTVLGSDVVFGNLEIMDSKAQRIISVPGSNTIDFNRRYTGINLYAPRSKVINTVIHDTYMGIGFWAAAVDSELYGNIFYNNGEQAPDRGHGHGIYTQNEVGRKYIEENITFGNFGGFGLQLYGSSNATLKGYTINGNINFLNQFLVGGNAPVDDIKLDSNFLYGNGFRLGYGNPYNGAITVTNNYSYASLPAEVLWWQTAVLNGNKFYHNGDPSGASMVLELPAGGSLSKYQINNNKYIFSKTWMAKPFFVKTPSIQEYSFTQWQQLGFDAAGNWLGATSTSQAIVTPTGVEIFYRPNKYEKGRAHIIIYNYSKVPSVSLDLSKTGLQPGQNFEIRNGQNFKAPPLVSGTYNGSPATVNVANLLIAQPVGNSAFRNPEIASQFSVLVVVPVTTSSVPPTTTPTVPSKEDVKMDGVTPSPTPTPAPRPTPRRRIRPNW